jgi:cell wall-associated NlpC family hydrolase
MAYEIDTQPIIDRYNKMFESGKSTLDINKKVKDTDLNNQALDVENKYKQLADTIVKQREEGKQQYYGERNLSDYNIAKETRAKNEVAAARNWRGGELIDINLKQNQNRINILTDISTKENTYNKQLDTNLATGTKEYNTQKSNITKARSSLLDEYNTNLANLKATNEAQKNAEISQKIAELEQRKWQSGQNMSNWQSQYQQNQNQIDANYEKSNGSNVGSITNGYMKGKENMITSAASKYGLDPNLLAAIVMWETGGNSPALRNQNNPGGIMGSGGLRTFGSLQEGLDYTAMNLKKYYIDKGLTSIAQIGNKYAPIGAGNDPTGLNNNWVKGVSNLYNKAKAASQSYTPSSGGGSAKGVAAVQNAAKFLGGKYVWGGTNPYTGIDCSGLTQYVLKQQGINIPRVSQDQYKAGTAVAKNNLQPGDLVFFITDGSTVSHVGIYEGNGNFVHAASTKRGIVRNNLGDSYYAQHYVGARRYI